MLTYDERHLYERKSTMCINTINDLKNRYDQIKDLSLSEIDTQILLIEPILQIAGWNIFDPLKVKRASRSSSKQEFDIEVYLSKNNPPRVKIAIECKSLRSSEFNFDKIDTKNGIGQLIQKQKKNKSLYWANKSGDGIGQLRAYCANYAHFLQDFSIPVLTNGFEWLIFGGHNFVNQLEFSSPVSKKDIISHGKLAESNFREKIVEHLRNTNA